MRERIEKMLKGYPQLIRERNCLAYQIEHFRGIGSDEIIESMYTSQTDGERVQTSGTSDKTAQIALRYRERQERVNREWLEHLEKTLMAVNDELSFFEAALNSLSGRLPSIMKDMVIEGMTWDALAAKYTVSSRMIGKYRRKALTELEALYATHECQTIDYVLG